LDKLAKKRISEKKLEKKTNTVRILPCRRALKEYDDGADGIHIFNDSNNRETFQILGSINKD